jgi:hypothetical protein
MIVLHLCHRSKDGRRVSAAANQRAARALSNTRAPEQEQQQEQHEPLSVRSLRLRSLHRHPPSLFLRRPVCFRASFRCARPHWLHCHQRTASTKITTRGQHRLTNRGKQSQCSTAAQRITPISGSAPSPSDSVADSVGQQQQRPRAERIPFGFGSAEPSSQRHSQNNQQAKSHKSTSPIPSPTRRAAMQRFREWRESLKKTHGAAASNGEQGAQQGAELQPTVFFFFNCFGNVSSTKLSDEVPQSLSRCTAQTAIAS